jgi:hypothetical protein
VIVKVAAEKVKVQKSKIRDLTIDPDLINDK